MKTKAFILLPFFVTLLVNLTGEVVTYDFKASVTDAHEDTSGLVNVGDQISGSISFDLGLIDTDDSESTGEYFSTANPAEVSVSFSGPGYALESDTETRHRILVTAGIFTSDTIALNVDFGIADGFSDGGFSILFRDGTLIQDSLPKIIDLSNFESAILDVSYEGLAFDAEIGEISRRDIDAFISMHRRNVPTLRVKVLYGIDFSGDLFESEDLKSWTKLDPQPSSPFIFNSPMGRRFFQARTTESNQSELSIPFAPPSLTP